MVFNQKRMEWWVGDYEPAPVTDKLRLCRHYRYFKGSRRGLLCPTGEP